MIKHFILLFIILLFTITALILALQDAKAAKPVDRSDAPFVFTVTAYVNQIQVGQNISWNKKDAYERDTSYQWAAMELFRDAPYLFPTNSHIRFYIQYPRYGSPAHNIYGCVGPMMEFTLHNSDGVCNFDAHDQRILEKVRVRTIQNNKAK